MIVQNISGREIKIPELKKVIPAKKAYYKIPYRIAFKYKKYLKPIQMSDDFVYDTPVKEGEIVTTPPQVNIKSKAQVEKEKLETAVEALRKKEEREAMIRKRTEKAKETRSKNKKKKEEEAIKKAEAKQKRDEAKKAKAEAKKAKEAEDTIKKENTEDSEKDDSKTESK